MFFKLLLLVAVATTTIQGAPILDQSLLQTLFKTGSADIVLTLSHDTTSQILSQLRLHTKNYATRGDKLEAVTGALKKATAHTQASILDFLRVQKPAGAVVTPFWITNKIVVRGADVHLIEKLLTRSDLVEIRQERIIPLEPFTLVEAEEKANEEWNIQLIRAPPVWATENRGQGAVVANIDTGVRVTHQALPNHRADHGWFDPEGATDSPSDSNGHGTYTLAVAAGSMKVGVAPGAQWVACKGCGAIACSEMALLSCGQWVACPTDAQGQNANCSLAPNVVSNSWGAASDGDAWFDDVLQTWRSGNIVPVFGVGNSGGTGACGTVGYPGSSLYSIAVGATTQEEISAEPSGTGPTSDGRIKPDLAAPGMNVRSAYGTADDAYMVLSGTSVAIPHVAGVAALILTERPDLTVDEVQMALQVAVKTESTGHNCGGVDENTFPNNHVGHGRVDAVNAVASVVGGK